MKYWIPLLIFLGSLLLLTGEGMVVDVHASSHPIVPRFSFNNVPGSENPDTFVNATDVNTLSLTIDFGQPVKGFDASDITVFFNSANIARFVSIQNLSPQPPSDTATSYTFDVSGFTDGTIVRISINSETVQSVNSQPNRNGQVIRMVIDQSAPTLVSAYAENVGTVVLAMSEQVYANNPKLTDFYITGAQLNPRVTSLDISGSVITLTLSARILSDDTPLIHYTAGSSRISDILGHPLESFGDKTIFYHDIDTVAPTLIFNANDVQNPTNLVDIPFTATFNEFVTGFDARDINTKSGTIENLHSSNRDIRPIQVIKTDIWLQGYNGVGIRGVTVNDVTGNIYASHDNHHRVYEFDEQGRFIGIFETDEQGLYVGSPAIDTKRNTLYVINRSGQLHGVAVFDSNRQHFNTIFKTGDSQLKSSSSVVIDSMNDKIYVADTGNNRVAMFKWNGQYIDSIDRLGVDGAQFNNIRDIAIDSADNIYVADNRNRVSIFDSNGEFIRKLTVSGVGTTGQIDGIAVDSNNDIYVTSFNTSVGIFDTNGVHIKSIRGKGNDVGKFGSAEDIAVGANGRIYVTELRNDRLQVFEQSNLSYHFDDSGIADQDSEKISIRGNAAYDNDGNGNVGSDELIFDVDRVVPIPSISTNVASPTNVDTIPFTVRFSEYVTGFDAGDINHTSGTVQNFVDGGISHIGNFDRFAARFVPVPYEPHDIAIGPDGKAYVADTNNNWIHIFNPQTAGDYLNFRLEPFPGDDNTPRPFGIAVGKSDGRIYLTDVNNDRILIYDRSGNYLRYIGGSDTSDGVQIKSPSGIAIGRNNGIFVADTDNNRILVFHNDGRLYLQFGGTGHGNGKFQSPEFVAVGPDGKIYVSDTGNSLIQIFDSGGNFLSQFNRLDTDKLRLNTPAGIDVGPDGKIYVVDSFNSLISIFDENGKHLQSFGATGSGSGQFELPGGISVDPYGIIYVADTDNSRFQAFSQSSTYSFEISNPTDPSTLIVNVPVDATRDAATNGNAMSNTIYLGIDRTPPVVSAASTVNTLTVLLVMSEPVFANNVTPGDFTISGVGSNPTVHNVIVINGTNMITLELSDEIIESDTDPLVSYDVGSNIVLDAAKNSLASFDNYNIDNTLDTTIPTVIITTNVTSPTNVDPIPFTVRFSEYVMGFDAGSINHTSGTIQNFTRGEISHFDNIWHRFTDSSPISSPPPSYRPLDVAIGIDGKIYTTNNGANRIDIFDRDGRYESKFRLPSFSNDTKPSNTSGIAVGPDGRIYITDNNNDRILIYDQYGRYLRHFGESGTNDNQITGPSGIAVGPDDRIYLVDTGNNRVQIFYNNGTHHSHVGENSFNVTGLVTPEFIAVGSDGRIYISEFLSRHIQIFSNDGDHISEFTGLGANVRSSIHYDIGGIALGPDGRIYVVSFDSDVIQVFDKDGQYLQKFGTLVKTGGNGEFNFPLGIAVDPRGKIYAADTMNNRIQVLSESSEYSFEISNPTDQSTLIVNVPVNATRDAGHNGNVMSNTISLDIDKTPPTVSSQSATSAITVELGIVEPVYGNSTITPADFTISGVATGANVTLIELVNGTSTITLTLSAQITGSDTPLISYTPGTNIVVDAAGNQLAAFSDKPISINFDLTMPTVTILADVTRPYKSCHRTVHSSAK